MTARPRFRGGVFTYEQAGQYYSLRRGRRAVELALMGGDNLALVGEDTTIEMGIMGEPLEVIAKNGRPLRFALLGRSGVDLAALQSRELVIATSYPVMAKQLMAELSLGGGLLEVGGCVEAELTGADAADAVIELVQSGDSVRQNGLAIIEDDLYTVRLMKVGKGEIV